MLSQDQTNFMGYIQAIGRGKKSGRYLSQNEALDAMGLLMQGKVTDEQKGAFLMLLRVREESSDEIAGFTQACRQTLTQTLQKTGVELDIPCYAGKRRQLPWFVLAAACLVEQGVKIGMHTTFEPQSQRLYIATVLDELFGSEAKHLIANTPLQCAERVKQHNFVYANLETLHKDLDHLIKLRAMFGLRSCANTLARLLNPFSAQFSVQGVHHKHLDDKHIEVATALHDKNVLCFRGEGGEPEVDPSKDTRLLFSRHGSTQEYVLAAQQRWELKPKALEPQQLKRLWKGAITHSYSEKSVQLTLSAYLMLLESISFQQANSQAKLLWEQRNRHELLGLLI